MTQPQPDRACQHLSVRAKVMVARLADSDPTPATIRWQATVDVQCTNLACRARLGWVGVPVGPLPDQPAGSVDGFTLTAPLSAPVGAPAPAPGGAA